MQFSKGSSALLALAFGAAPAFAQQAPAEPPIAPAQASTDDFGTIVVTARRKSENAQTVPVAIAAFSSGKLQEKSVQSLSDLTSITPGLRVVNTGGGFTADLSLRGLSKVPTGDSPGAVITYFADVPLTNQASVIPSFDIDNVQVLKGPQGTLFGRNTIGGAILVQPKLPGYDFEGYARVGAGGAGYRLLEGAINVPIVSEKVALRIAGQVRRRDGYTKNLGIGGDLDKTHQDSVRVSLLLEPFENFRNVTIFDQTKDDNNGPASVLYKLTDGGLIRLPQLASVWDCHTVNEFNPVPCTGFQPDRDIDDALIRQEQIGPRRTITGSAPLNTRTLRGITNRAELKLGSITVRDIFGYREADTNTTSQTDGLNFSPPLFDARSKTSNRQVTNELQILGNLFNDRVDYIAGVFYGKISPLNTAGDRFDIVSPGAPWVVVYTHRRNVGVFGQVGVTIANGLKINGGYRYNWDRVRVCTGSTPTGPVPSVGPQECSGFPGVSNISAKSSAPTWTIGANYQVTPELFTYVTARQGYRQGGINTPVFDRPGSAIFAPYQSYDPERVNDIEAGLKSNWHVGGADVLFNVSLFRTRYSHRQVLFNVAGLVSAEFLPSQGSLVVNAPGETIIRGAEIEFAARITPALSVNANTAYTKAKADPFVSPLIGAAAPSIGVPTPRWTTNLGARYELPFHPFGTNIVYNIDYYYNGSWTIEAVKLPRYDVTNMRLDIQRPNDGPSLSLFLRNAFNQTNVIAGSVTVNALGPYTVLYNEPRTMGVELGYRW